MSNLSVICNACKQPVASCSCARNPMYPTMTWPQTMQFQTPSRPSQHNVSTNSFTQITPRPQAHVPVMPFYAPRPQQMYDPRFHGLPTMPSEMHPPPPQFQSLYPLTFSQATPMRQSIQTDPEMREPLSPIQPSPVPANSQKRKCSDGARAAAPKRTRRSQARPQVSNENASFSVPGVGPSSHVHESQAPAALPQPIADYSPIAKPRKAPESNQAASDVWYFMRPLDARECPTGPLHDPETSRTKPKSSFVGCRLCPL
jgi:hypothetical protein